MATARTAPPLTPFSPLTVGVSTKGDHHDDALARVIEDVFVRRVDPMELLYVLPHNLLTRSDEERIRAWQHNYGPMEGARLMLQFLVRRGDWLPPLLQALRHRHVRLSDLADEIEMRQVEVPMEVDLDGELGTDGGMEVDSQPVGPDDPDRDPAAPAAHGAAGPPPAASADPMQLLVDQLAETVCERLLHKLEQSPILLRLFDSISALHASTVALGCLEVRFPVTCTRDLKRLRKLLEGGAARDALEKGLLTRDEREWLEEQAASRGFRWQKMKLKIKVKEGDLDRLDAVLRAREALPTPTSAAQALLLQSVRANVFAYTHVRRLPRLLVTLVDWLLVQHVDLAHQVVRALSQPPLHKALQGAMQACREHFKADEDEHGQDLAAVAMAMLEARESGQLSADLSFKVGEAGVHRTDKLPYVEVEPNSYLAEAVKRLQESGLVVSAEILGKENAVTFASPFVADFALSLTVQRHSDWASDVLRLGSQFAVLHIIEPELEPREGPPLTIRPKHSLGTPLATILAGEDLPHPVVEMILSFPGNYSAALEKFAPGFCAKYGTEVKKVLTSRHSRQAILSKLQQFTLLPVDACQPGTRTLLKQVLTARKEVDLQEKLTDMSEQELQAVLTCIQLNNTAGFSLTDADGWVALKIDSSSMADTAGGDGWLQPALRLGQNRLETRHVDSLVRAMEGLEWVVHFDLTACTLDPGDLQRLLDAMHVERVEELTLTGLPLTSTTPLPTLSRLRRLRVLDVSSTGLRDDHMDWLAAQLLPLPDLRELTLDQNVITTLGLSRLTPALGSRRSLRILRLAHCTLDAGAAYVLGCLLDASRDLHILNLSHCHLLDSGLEHLSRALQHHVRLTKVSLRSGHYTPASLASFFTHLARCGRMQHLEVGECTVQEASDKLLAALSVSGYWDYLGLWRCKLGATHFTQGLCTLTWQLRGLSTLILQDNDLNDIHVSQLADAVELGVFRYLRHLNLRQNDVSAMGATRLADVLPRLPYLQDLLLQHSNIPSGAAQCLCLAALPMPALETLDLSDSYSLDPLESHDILHGIVVGVQEGGVALATFDTDPAEQKREFKVLTDPNMMGFSPGQAVATVRTESFATSAPETTIPVEEEVTSSGKSLGTPVALATGEPSELPEEDTSSKASPAVYPHSASLRGEPDVITLPGQDVTLSEIKSFVAEEAHMPELTGEVRSPGKRMTAEMSADYREVVVDGKLHIILGHTMW